MDVAEILTGLHQGTPRAIARAISLVEDLSDKAVAILAGLNRERIENALVVGITGPPGAGKSTLTNSLIKQLRLKQVRVGIIAVDPSSPISGGALLGDRIRMMDHALDPEVVVRSMATRGRLGGLCAAAGSVVRIMAAAGCRVVIIETVGTGQSEMDIVRLADLSVMVLAPGFGDDIQAMKAGILEVADLLVINKADKPGAGRLALDLGSWFSSGNKAASELLKTVASENKGVDILLQRLYEMEQQYRNQGLLKEKRTKAFKLETIDWALEILRTKLTDKVQTISARSEKQEPQQAAAALVAEMFSGDKK